MSGPCLSSIVAVLLCGLGLFTSDVAAQGKGDDSGAKAPQVTMKGSLKADGEKYTFVNDKDGKTWNVINPEELKGHQGHHVEITGRIHPDKDGISIMSIKMLKGGEVEGGPPTGEDPPKRPPPPPPPSN